MENATDMELWDRGVAVVTTEYAALSSAIRDTLRQRTVDIRNGKTALHALVAGRGGEGLCVACAGACCATGKYHFTVVDLLCFLAAGRVLFSPRFSAAACPYLGEAGCVMAPDLRPSTCLTFICEEIEVRLPFAEREECRRLEAELRALSAAVERLFDGRFLGSLLIASEREILRGGGGILGLPVFP